MGRAVPPSPHSPAFTTLREAPQLVSDLISADCAHAACSGESLRCCQWCCQGCACGAASSAPPRPRTSPTPGHSGGHQAPGSEPAGDTEPWGHLPGGAGTTCSTPCSPVSAFPLCLSPRCLTSPCACRAGF